MEDEKAKAAKQSGNVSKITKVGNVIETCAESLKSVSSGNAVQVMKGCLRIASSVAAMVGGPYGAASAAICGILTSILSASSPKEPDLVTVFTDTVHAELLRFNQESQRQTFEGLKSRVKIMNGYLRELKRDDTLPDKGLYETHFPHFIGEVAHCFTKGLNEDSTEEEVKRCLASMAIYCNAQTALFLLLTNILATFQSTGHETKMIKILLDNQIQDAHDKLGFLFQHKYLRMSSVFTIRQHRHKPLNEDDFRKVMTILHIGKCRHLPSYNIIEGFGEGLGMLNFPQTIERLFKGANNVLKDITHHYCPTKGYNSYFQLINHSHVPVQVMTCGTEERNRNGMTFYQVVPPYSSYEHVTKWFFSTGGMFYMDFENRRTETQNLKAFEFALSSPLIGPCKSSIREMNPQHSFNFEKGFWDLEDDCPPVFF